jgi:lipoprotein LprG
MHNPFRRNPPGIYVLLIILAGLLLAGCSEPEPEIPSPEEIVANAAGRMSALEGFHFTIDLAGESVFLDADQLISFRYAEGDYVSPDAARATVRVLVPGLATEISVISIGETQWETGMLTAGWSELPPNWGFNPVVLFDPEIGIQSILASDLSKLTLEESEPLDEGTNEALHVISGTLDGARINEMSYGLIGPEPLEVRLWIAPGTFDLHRAVIEDRSNLEGEEPRTWQVDFSEFGQVVDIVPPPAAE